MLILASKSPRRRELIARLGVPYEVCASDADESVCGLLAPDEYVKTLALRKAQAAANTHPGDVVLGVDTVVVLDGRILGKPQNICDAAQMLRALSG